jgi:hypothetical protein
MDRATNISHDESIVKGFLCLRAQHGPIFFFFFFAVLGFELKAYTLSHSTSPFFFFLVMSFFEIGSHKLFFRAGFEP